KKEKRGQKQEGLWKLTPLMEIRPEHGFPQRLGKHKTLPTVSTRPYGDDETSILNCKADISHATKSGHLHVLTTGAGATVPEGARGTSGPSWLFSDLKDPIPIGQQAPSVMCRNPAEAFWHILEGQS